MNETPLETEKRMRRGLPMLHSIDKPMAECLQFAFGQVDEIRQALREALEVLRVTGALNMKGVQAQHWKKLAGEE